MTKVADAAPSSNEDQMKQLEVEIKADETSISKLKDQMTTAEKTLADHKDLLVKKKDLLTKEKEKKDQEQKMLASKESLDKQEAVKKALADVTAAEQKVESDLKTNSSTSMNTVD